MTVTLTQSLPGSGPHPKDGGWISVATHSHTLRSHAVDFEQAKRNLVEWARTHQIDVVGIGSPWEPVSARHYKQCETVDRDAYFGGRIDPETVMDREPIGALIRELNTMAEGRPRFLLDNETPKNRHGHLWYVGFDYQVPCWHDYSQDRRVQFWDGDPCEDPNALTGGCHRRRSYAEVVARQRQAGALAIWAHPTSWWTQKGAFITNIAAELVLHLLADGFLDGMVVQGYDACHRAYQALWFDLLDRGAAVPGYAELDACFDTTPIAAAGTFLNNVPAPHPHPPLSTLIPTLRAARHFVSSGPHLDLRVDRQPTGAHIASGGGCVHHAVLTAWPAPGERRLSHVEILGPGGTVLTHLDNFPGGTIECQITADAAGGYILARAFGEHDAHTEPRQQRIRQCALTNPVWLDTPTSPRIHPVRTHLSLAVRAGGPADGATFQILDAAGDRMESGRLTASGAAFDIHPLWRIVISQTDGSVRDIPIAMANPAVRAHINHLADGGFRTDNPALAQGDVPVSAFRFDALREALANQTLNV